MPASNGTSLTPVVVLSFALFSISSASLDHLRDPESELLEDLFAGYQRFTRPVWNHTHPSKVYIGMQFVLLVNVNERAQTMKSNVWIKYLWLDEFLRWNSSNYGGISTIRVPSWKVWLPDIVLYNNADGRYEPKYKGNVMLHEYGFVIWSTPILYKSTCRMDIEHFPFDEQYCDLKFISWTYNKSELRLGYNEDIKGIDLSQFYFSSIWDIVDCPARLSKDKDAMTFTVVLRRKTLFYTVVLIVPSVLMAMVVVVTFYLPTDAGEKIGLSILNLLSVTVFLLLLCKILPASSTSVPLLARYLLLVFVINCLVILLSVVTVNLHFRCNATHVMPRWIRSTFLEVLPRILAMQKPGASRKHRLGYRRTASQGSIEEEILSRPNIPAFSFRHHPLCRHSQSPAGTPSTLVKKQVRQRTPEPDYITADQLALLPDGIRKCVHRINLISRGVREKHANWKIRDDWKFVALVLDRILLCIFVGILIGSTLGLFLSAPHIMSGTTQREHITRLGKAYDWEKYRHMGDQIPSFDP